MDSVSLLTMSIMHVIGIPTEEELLAGTLVDEFPVGSSQDLHDARQLLLLVFARENREASIQLSQDTA